MPLTRMFQSAPGLTVGRCQRPCQPAHCGRAVSIRARPHGRAMRPDVWELFAASMFQSAPGLTVGRCMEPQFFVDDARVFQSAPGLTVGRCVMLATCGTATMVSIRARPHGRAMRRGTDAALRVQKFQSAPGLTVGRC